MGDLRVKVTGFDTVREVVVSVLVVIPSLAVTRPEAVKVVVVVASNVEVPETTRPV